MDDWLDPILCILLCFACFAVKSLLVSLTGYDNWNSFASIKKNYKVNRSEGKALALPISPRVDLLFEVLSSIFISG